MHDFRVCCSLDLEFPGAAGYSELARDWLIRGSRELAGEYLEAIESGEPLDPGSVRRGGPAGPPGSVWGFVAVARGAWGSRRTGRVYSAKNVAWLEKQLLDPAAEATLGVSVLDDTGVPGESPLRATVQRLPEAEDWLTLSFSMQESRLARPEVQRSLLSFVRSVADRVNPSFGQCDYDDVGTAVERTVGPPWPMPSETVPRSRNTLRGYSWLTVCAQELADRLGGADALRATGAFHEVEQLAAGGVWLLATADYRDYDQAAVERVFEAVAPVLPPGMPRRFDSADRPPNRVAVRDAASVRAGGA
ncbi:hypothetical protein [Actinoplanes subtropicus]|uniref:hypothetical protein n=1 Tax=Actinoplanes subtropicus TaxID=543632 RepID=UPI0004C3289F|nr:hypothetical protein [Actinoplanes subtropicus]